jgi:hypothetical protein
VAATTTSELTGRALALADEWADPGAAGELVQLAGGWRGPLEAARDALVARLHRDPGDLRATNALRLVLRALERARFETVAAH